MKKLGVFVAMLAMVAVAIVPALAQDGAGSDVITTEEEPVATCAWGPTEVSTPENPYAPNALDPSDHAPGEFIVSYESVEAMWASPQENVNHQFNRWDSYDTETGPVYYPIPIETQTLYFEDIASIADPCERFAAEEAKRQEILTWPGVEYASYNGYSYIDNDVAPSG